MPVLNPQALVTADGVYTYEVSPHKQYDFSLGYLAGTATVTVKRRIGTDGTDYVTYKLPDDKTADMALAATGTETGYRINATSNRIVFDVSSASGLSLKIDIYKVS